MSFLFQALLFHLREAIEKLKYLISRFNSKTYLIVGDINWLEVFSAEDIDLVREFHWRIDGFIFSDFDGRRY